jgi:hypothetical protein
LGYKEISNVDWKMVLESAEYNYNTSTWIKRGQSWIRAFIRLFIRLPSVGSHSSLVDILFVKSLSRDDYDELFERVVSCCPQDKYLEYDVYGSYDGAPYSRISFFSFGVLIKYFPFLISFINWNLSKSVYVMTHVLLYLRVFEYLNKSIEYKNLIVFADMQAIDNLLVQTAKLKNITTVTLQHGLYIDYSRMENINSINYKNQVADYFLAWGNSTKELIQKYNPHTCVEVCGKPIEYKEISSQKEDYFTVLFDQELLMLYNRKLLNFAYKLQKKTQLNVNIRFHPHNNEADYDIKKSITYINKEPEASVFVLAHTTSMIHELLRIGIPVFKFKSDVPALNVPEFLEFSTIDELEKAINQNDIQTHDFKEDGKEFINYIGDEALGRYREFFARLQK